MSSVSCPTSHTFYRLRQALTQALDVPRDAVRPDSRLEDLIPGEQRRAVWRQLRKAGFALPGLGLSPSLRLRYHLAWLALGAVEAMLWLQGFVPGAGVVLKAMLWLLTRRYAVHVRRGPVTVRDVVIYCTSLRKKDIPPGHRWSHDDISLKVRLMFSEHFDIPLEKVKPESRLKEDLGLE